SLLFKKTLNAAGYVIFGGVLSSCYVTTQAWTQAKLLNRRKPISEVLIDPAVDEAIKNKLKFTKAILTYAETQVLQVDDSYSKFVPLDGPAVSYLVQAARPDEFKLKTWWFPVVGTVPYLGFFDVADRNSYASTLEADGYEVSRPSAAAFSSLGWFSDPIYSSMLLETDADLAQLYFHELTHKTAWIAGGVELNENLAEFIGEEMTERFFKAEARLDELEAWNRARRDFVRAKKQLIADHVGRKPAFEATNLVGLKEWNTPRILGASLYSPDTALFKKAYGCSGSISLGDFARKVKIGLAKSDRADEGLKDFCAG
ncbi:MAG: aminopeptidase, partial [Proteobacteria bacterium]|nr:aminopeptidase [Pseudomonadota bacterium]